MNDIATHSIAPHDAVQPGVTIKNDWATLVSPSNQFQRSIPLDQSQSSTDPVMGLFTKEHRGKLPSIMTGFSTESRKQMAAVGVHRALMAGIQGSQASGIVFSIAMSGEYEDNEDNGEYIIYTGSGGRDSSSGSKKQTFDQTLDGRNLLLAKCCPVPIDLKNGSDAGDNWRNGVPIRVVRGSKSLRFSGSRSYGPSEGYRYDGVYKVVMYWPTKGTSGFKVWRFMLRRDDPSPTPWSIEDKFMRKHCPMYRDTQNEKRHQYWTSMRRVIDNLQPAVGYGRQAKTFDYTDTMIEQDIQATLESDKAILEKEMDRAMYIPDDPLKKTILLDAMNRRIWMRVCNREYQRKVGIRDYLSFIEVAFTQPEFQCLICNDKVAHRSHKQYRDGLSIPLVHFASLHCMRCDYNFCKDCLKPMFIRDIRCCPNCLAVGSLERNINLKRVYQAAHIEPITDKK